jgi:hypothetical protein
MDLTPRGLPMVVMMRGREGMKRSREGFKGSGHPGELLPALWLTSRSSVRRRGRWPLL